MNVRVRIGLAKGAPKSHAKSRGGRPMVIAVVLCVIVIVAAFYFFVFYPHDQIVQSWSLHIVFFDYRLGVNYTLPANIGVSGGIWTNHTLDGFGPPGYAPLSTRDGTNTVYIRSSVWELYTLEDFFNIWGQTFNQFCVPQPPLWDPNNPYCTQGGEPVLYDPNKNSTADSQTQVLYNGTNSSITSGTKLTYDPLIKYVDLQNLNHYVPGDPVVYDFRSTGYVLSTDWIVNSTSGSNPPAAGTQLKTDTSLRFVDSLGNGAWEQPRFPPAMSNGNTDSCVNPAYGLSNHIDWIIFLYSGLASSIQGNCVQ